MDRAHRIGQDKPVFVHHLIAENTVEVAIQTMQRRKQALADALFEGTRGPFALTEDDLRALRYALTASAPVIASLERTTELPFLDAFCNGALRPGRIVPRRIAWG